MLNLHNIAGGALAGLNTWQEAKFTRTLVNYQTGEETATTFTLQVKLQPASLYALEQLGYNVTDYQYYKIFASGDVRTLESLEGNKADTFELAGKVYKIVAVMDWSGCGFRECYAYKME